MTLAVRTADATLPGRRRFLSLSFALALAGCASAPLPQMPSVAQGDADAVMRYVDQRIGAEMARWNIKGVSVALVDDQRVLLSKGYGLADAAHAVAATADTQFRAGSISKLFTATDAVRRAELGEIQLDGTLASQLTGFTIHNRFEGSAPLTLRSMLAHHSGLPSDVLKGMWLAHPPSLASLQADLADESLINPPQTQYRYSNLDYGLLGRLIEVRSGMPFAEAISQGLLQPLGLRQTVFERNAEMPGTAALGYRNGREAAAVGLRDDAAGAVLTSASDMATFMRFLFAGGQADGRRVVGRAALEAMFTPQYAGLPLDFGHRIGLGWMLSGVEVPGASSVAWHTGEYPGYFSAVLVLPEHKLGIVILANDENAKKFALDVGAQALTLALEARTGVHHATPAAQAQPARVTLSTAQLDTFGGPYAIFGSLARITRSGDLLSADLFGTPIDLVPVGEQRFVLQKSVLGLVSLPLGKLALEFTDVGARRFAVLRGLPAPQPFERLAPTPLPEAWQRRLGTYVTDDSDNNMRFGSLELAVEDGVLVARSTVASPAWGTPESPIKVPLTPLDAKQAAVTGADGMAGSVLAVRSRQGEEGLRYSGYFFRRAAARP